MATTGSKVRGAAIPRALCTCACCGSTRVARARTYACEDPIFAARVHPTLELLRCAACGLLQVDHVHLDAEEFEVWHRQSQVARARVARTWTAMRWLEARSRALAELSRRFHDAGQVDRIFQFGAGPGLDLVALQRVHLTAECWADRLDANAEWRSLARVGSLDEGPFDRVVMTHVLGAVPDPVRFVRRAITALRPGGLLIVEVGNDIDASLDRRCAFEPQLTFFTVQTLHKLFVTNFADDLQELHLATAGPRPEDVARLEQERERGFFARLFRPRSEPVDVADDPEATDRAFARVVLRRRDEIDRSEGASA